MIPFFQSNSLDDKYITGTKDIEKSLSAAMRDNKLFQLTISGLENSSVSRILSIDKSGRQINFEDPGHGFDDIAELEDAFAVTAEFRSDNKIMRFESMLLKESKGGKQFSVNYPKEIEKNIKRQAPRYQPRRNVKIPISFYIKGHWREVALLTDISQKGIGFIVRESSWKYMNKGLKATCMLNIENTLTLKNNIEIMHTFTVLQSGNKHAGAKFIDIEDGEKELSELIGKMLELKIISR